MPKRAFHSCPFLTKWRIDSYELSTRHGLGTKLQAPVISHAIYTPYKFHTCSLFIVSDISAMLYHISLLLNNCQIFLL